MPGMSPNKKAAKGVFGAGGTVPQISGVTPPSGTVVAVGDLPLAATAVAVDDVDGDISASLTWTSDLDGAVGTTGAASLTLSTIGDHVITVEATATTGGATNSTQLTVTVVA